MSVCIRMSSHLLGWLANPFWCRLLSHTDSYNLWLVLHLCWAYFSYRYWDWAYPQSWTILNSSRTFNLSVTMTWDILLTWIAQFTQILSRSTSAWFPDTFQIDHIEICSRIICLEIKVLTRPVYVTKIIFVTETSTKHRETGP